MTEALVQALLKSAPFYGPVIVALAIALVWVTLQWQKAMEARVTDAQDTTKTLVSSGDKVSTALNAVVTVVQANSTELARLGTAVDNYPRRKT